MLRCGGGVGHEIHSSGRSRISHRGDVGLIGGAWTPEAATFIKFVCQNERIRSLGGTCQVCPPGSANA